MKGFKRKGHKSGNLRSIIRKSPENPAYTRASTTLATKSQEKFQIGSEFLYFMARDLLIYFLLVSLNSDFEARQYPYPVRLIFQGTVCFLLSFIISPSPPKVWGVFKLGSCSDIVALSNWNPWVFLEPLWLNRSPRGPPPPLPVPIGRQFCCS